MLLFIFRSNGCSNIGVTLNLLYFYLADKQQLTGLMSLAQYRCSFIHFVSSICTVALKTQTFISK